ncbi:MAG TPA: hypothetical protein VGO53_13805, partial [Steroidobacteraceae bacterium]|nr:hypothetical protein [Steroidobacteraceae bacterium]
PEEQIFTFWDYFRNHWARNSGLRIDHLLLSKSLAPRLVDANVDRWVRGVPHASDHAPTWVVINREEAPKRSAKKGSQPRAAAPPRPAKKAPQAEAAKPSRRAKAPARRTGPPKKATRKK